MKKGSAFEYQYAIADHQGNTRVVFTAATPTPDAPTATFEGDGGDGTLEYTNIDPSNVVTFVGANHTPGGSKVVRMNQTYKVGPSKSVKVYPGDKVDIEVWEYHEGSSGFGATSTPLTTLITMVSGAFGGVSGGGGESGLIYSGVNAAINAFVPGGNLGTDRPAAYLNYILFDENYNLLDMGWQPAPDVTFSKQKLSFNTINVKQEGFLFAYLSYDNDSNNWVYFDDFKVTHTPTNVLQYNEYYPFGLQTSSSWTRENSNNNYLYNAGNELNGNSGWYETFFRGYDPVLGRFNQVDPLAYASSSHTPYNYAFNDPVYYNDPMGDYPDYVYFESFEQSAGGSMFDSPMESKPWYRVGPGSGNNPMDRYRSVEGKARVMSHRQFNMFYGTANSYGVNEQRRYDVAQSAGQAPTQDDLSAVNAAFGTSFELGSNGVAGYWDMPYYYGGAGATWVSVGAQQGAVIPSPADILNGYPDYPGEYCSQADNECAIRMSFALSNTGVDISGSNQFRKTHTDNGVVHQPSAAALADWLSQPGQLGSPKIYIHPTGDWSKSDFINKEGLIYFAHPHRGGTGPGHIDVISGGNIGSGFYDNKIIWFWEYKNGSYVNN